ncbi:PrsW family intramembrane metalloprotease [Cryptosporangium minutisporangium]|uniref:PrsW family intramembrane metalloprotease n=1 Tax=Cryptosporangium minutisporangium TaxID=113569 RepID=UPI0035E6B23C
MVHPPAAPGLPGQPGVPHPSEGMAKAAPMVPWHKRRWVGIAIAVLAVGIIGLAGLGIYGILGYSLGPVALILALGTAVLPVPILLAFFWWLDRYEPEPRRYLAFAFGWGACVATFAALIINSFGGRVITGAGGSESTTAVLVAPPTEEFFKAVPLFVLLGLALTGRRQINGVVDGIVYAGMSAVGFAFTENVLYFGSAYLGDEEKDMPGGITALIVTFVLRGIFSPFAHPLFTAMTGVGIGLAVRSRQTWVRIVAPIGGLVLAILLHGTWNLLASSQDFGIILTGYVVIMLPILAVMVTVAIVLRGREAKVVGRVLPVYAEAGWFTPQEIAALATMQTRRAGRQWARQIAGGIGAKAMSDYQFAATKLAIARDSLARGMSNEEFADEERQLLATVDARRQYILQHARPGSSMPWATAPVSLYPGGHNPNYVSGSYPGPGPGPSQYGGGVPNHTYGPTYYGGGHHTGYQPQHAPGSEPHR